MHYPRFRRIALDPSVVVRIHVPQPAPDAPSATGGVIHLPRLVFPIGDELHQLAEFSPHMTSLGRDIQQVREIGLKARQQLIAAALVVGNVITLVYTLRNLRGQRKVMRTRHTLRGHLATALLAGGALMDTAAFSQWCEAHPGLDVGDCDLFKEHQGELAELAGLDTALETLWSSLGTPDVDAIVGLAPDPAGRLFRPDGTAAVKVPTWLMVGSADS